MTVSNNIRYHKSMMKSKKKMKGRAKKAAKIKVKVKAKKTGYASVMRSHQRIELLHDPPLTVSEIDRVKESRQNFREGKYREFETVDDVWKFAESE